MIQTIGIIGAGQMVNGIAHVLAVAGYDILLTDTSNAQMQKALKAIGNNLSRQVSRGRLDQVVDPVRAREERIVAVAV